MSTFKINLAPVTHLDPALVASIISGDTKWDTLNFRESYEAGAAERAAVPRVLEANLDLPNAVHIVRQSMPKVLLLMPEIEKLPVRVDLIKRADFYAEARAPRTALVIATGEQRRFANLLLTVGVVFPPADIS